MALAPCRVLAFVWAAQVRLSAGMWSMCKQSCFVSDVKAPCRFKIGRQEDAHEYLRCLLDYMHESHIACCDPKPPAEVQRTSWVHTLFGGRTRSQLQCIGVKYESSIFEPFLDLSLQINRCLTLLQSLF